MSSTVVVPKYLARHFNNTAEIAVEASDLNCALETLSRNYQLDGILLTPEGHLQPFIRVVIGEDVVTSRNAADMGRVGVAGKTIHILTAFAGG